MKRFRVSEDEFFEMISRNLKTPITREDVFTPEIKLSHLKRIADAFNKSIHFLLDPSPVLESPASSIFFRKDKFQTDLNIGSKKIVAEFEELKISLSAISKLSDFTLERKLPTYSTSDNPIDIVAEVRKYLYPKDVKRRPRDFLKDIIGLLGEHNIYVFEFVETWNKKEKANINGFYLKPNMIVLKRQQRAFRREIFTLAHELGHFLLEKEEIEDVSVSFDNKLSKIEDWCNKFAFYFLLGDLIVPFSKLPQANSSNDYHHKMVKLISDKTHLSVSAIYTNLLLSDKITQTNYWMIHNEREQAFADKLQAEQKQKDRDKANGQKSSGGRAPQAIKSPLFIETMQLAYYEGVINEMEFCTRLKIKADKFDQYIQ